jgi:hypothetical protein
VVELVNLVGAGFKPARPAATTQAASAKARKPPQDAPVKQPVG